MKLKDLLSGLKRSAFGILWLLGTLGMVWVYNNTNSEVTYHKIYAPENMTRQDDFRGYDVKEISMDEFQLLPKDSPKVLRVYAPGNEKEIKLTYYGKSDKYLGNVKTTQKIAHTQQNIMLSYEGSELLSDGRLKISWTAPDVGFWGILSVALAFFMWIFHTNVFDDKKKKSSQAPCKC